MKMMWSELSFRSFSENVGSVHHPEQVCRHSFGCWGQPEALDHCHGKHEGRRYNPEL